MSLLTNLFTSSNNPNDSIDYQEILEKLDLQTGDIILMNGHDYWFSSLVEKITHSPWSHVGIVLKDPTWIDPALKGYYFWQSGTEQFLDAENEKKFGVRIDDLVEVLSEYDGNVSVRKLELKEPIPNFEEKLREIHHIVHGASYDLDILDFLEAREHLHTSNSWFSKWSKKTNTFFCSALTAYIYCKLGLIPSNTEWSRCEPKTFSELNPSLKLELGATLSSEISLIPYQK